jgi:hypothetical protein
VSVGADGGTSSSNQAEVQRSDITWSDKHSYVSSHTDLPFETDTNIIQLS